MRKLALSSLICAAACGSSSSDPIDPVASAYCAECSAFANCERLVTQTIQVICQEQTSAYYSCVTDNACEVSACAEEWSARETCMGSAPVDAVRARIVSWSPSANLGHRGTGPTRQGHPFPENSIASFSAAIKEGAAGIELDAEITTDGQIVVMHDDTLDRTTDCSGCVSAMTLDEIRACRLLDGDGAPTDEHPPTLAEVYDAIDGDTLINIELKVFGSDCETNTTGADALVDAVLAEVIRIGGERRTLFSSFDETAVALVKTLQPGFYSALIVRETDESSVEKALSLGQDALHPFFSVSAETVQSALDAGLQVNVWTVDTADFMEQQLEKGSTAIITNQPGILADLLSDGL